jgi:hypothetical protein
VSTWTTLSLMARYAIATVSEVARAAVLHVRDRVRKSLEQDVYPGLLRVFVPRDRRSGE